MREWRDATVARILSLEPKRVLEIGCGTGLLLLRVAPQCSLYVGTDFSAATLAQLQPHITDLPHVRLLERTADDLEELDADALDTVIINSVSQYFPSIGYLLRVVTGAVNAVADGGTVLIGDVRNLSLLKAFHAEVLLHRADARMSKAQFAEQLQRQVQTEKELLIDPAFFTAVLPQRFRRINRVEVQLKRGRHHNELTQFRYDVTLHIHSPATESAEPGLTPDLAINAAHSATDPANHAGAAGETPHPKTQWLDWQQDALTPFTLRTLLENTLPEHSSLCITNVPNARLHTANQILTWLNTAPYENGRDTVDDFLTTQAPVPPGCAIDPEQLFALVDNHQHQVSLSWSTGDPAGRFDILLHRRGTPAPAHRAAIDSRPMSSYANTPLQPHLQRHLVIDLRRFLQQRLPDYMVPATFLVLHKWPITSSGKVDRRALPAPDQVRPELDQDYVAPRNAIEEVLAALWANVLNLDRVGIHDNFFDLGGHSLLATQLISRARNLFQSELPLRWIFDASTVAAFAAILVANEPRPGQTEKIAAAFLKVKAMKLEPPKPPSATAHP